MTDGFFAGLSKVCSPAFVFSHYNQRMDWIDVFLATGLIALLAVTFGLLLPPYGYIGGALIGAFLAWRALKQRRSLLKKHEEDNK